MAKKENETTTDTVGTEAPHDRIQMASRHADGSIANVDPEFIGDKDTVLAANKEQLRQIASSNHDKATIHANGTTDEDNALDPITQKRVDEHKALHEQAEKQAESEVNSRHESASA